MTPAWAQRQEELWSDCIVSPDVFNPMVDRLGDFVVPYQYALEAEASQRHVHRYLAGLRSHLDRKNAEKIATLVDVERQVMQDFIGTACNFPRYMGPSSTGVERRNWLRVLPIDLTAYSI